MKKHAPNILTIFRVLLVPVFIWLIIVNYQFYWAAAVFIIASITDYFDGLLARKFKVISNFGKIMDPLADKLLIISALFVLSLKLDYIHISIVIIIIFREIIITILRSYYANKNIFIAANIWGKLKTILQLTGIIFCLLFTTAKNYISFPENIENSINFGIQAFFWIVAIITILSGLNYFIIKQK